MKFAVFALGNSSYPRFCSFGKFVHESLVRLGALQILEIELGDELNGQEESFKKWSSNIYQVKLETNKQIVILKPFLCNSGCLELVQF